MRFLRRFLTRLLNWGMRQTRRAIERQIDKYVGLQASENAWAVFTPVEARPQALLNGGDVATMKRDSQAERAVLFIYNLLGDLRKACRTMRAVSIDPV